MLLIEISPCSLHLSLLLIVTFLQNSPSQIIVFRHHLGRLFVIVYHQARLLLLFQHKLRLLQLILRLLLLTPHHLLLSLKRVRSTLNVQLVSGLKEQTREINRDISNKGKEPWALSFCFEVHFLACYEMMGPRCSSPPPPLCNRLAFPL